MSVSDPDEKLSGERIANLEKMSECPALVTADFLADSAVGSEVLVDPESEISTSSSEARAAGCDF